MTENKYKRVVVASTVGAVLLLVILIIMMLYQLISIGVMKKKKAELETAIAQYTALNESAQDTYEARSTRWWIELRARELGYTFDGDKLYPTSN